MRGGWVFVLAAAVAGPATAQPAMSRSETAQLYGAAGFPITAGRPANSCGRPAAPKMTFVDIGGDARQEVLVIDVDPSCYTGAKSYFAVLAREGKSWRQLISGTGTIAARATRTAGWLDMTVTQARCTRSYAFDGTRYAPAGPCGGVTAPPVAPPRKPASASAPVAAPAPAPARRLPASLADLTPADRAAIFKAAGAVRRGSKWVICAEDAQAEASIDELRDVNGDGRAEAIVSEGGLFCHGNTGTGFTLLSQRTDGGWTVITVSTGIPEFLKTRGAGGWPDISIGGPGFCFPVVRYDGRSYELNRHEYQGKPCRRP